MKNISEYIKESYWTSTSTSDVDDMDLSKVKVTDDNIKDIIAKILKKNKNADLNSLDVSEIIDMEELFAKMKDINPDISKWDVSNVQNMRSMFEGCENFNQNISSWDVSNVKDMRYMFYNCKNFNQNLSVWDVRNIKDATDMFNGCPIKDAYKPKFKNK